MKYSAYNYAKALIDLTKSESGDKKALISKFAKTLERHNSLSMMPEIINAYEEVLLQSRGVEKVTVKYAGKIDKDVFKKTFGDKIEIEFVETGSLIGGVQIFVRDIRIDNSIIGRLSALKKITH
jgi:F0F1-type ATP synthase delta subunit